MDRQSLVIALKRIQNKLCAYTKQPCDCKFISESASDTDICRGSENGSGCPEVYIARQILGAMTDKEFNRIIKRARLSSHFDKVPKTKKIPTPVIDNELLDKAMNSFVESMFNIIVNSKSSKQGRS